MLLSVACAKVNKYAKVENDNLAGSIVLNDANKKLDIDEKEGEKQEKSTSMSTLEESEKEKLNKSVLNMGEVEPNSIEGKRSVAILYYHSINDITHGIKELFVSPGEFEKQMKYLKDNNYNVIDYNEFLNNKNIEKPIIITFDDGYEDNYTNAYPILKKYNYKATIFVMTDAIGSNLYLKENQIKEMTDLISFESHTKSHPDLRKLSQKDLQIELVESQRILENITGRKPTSIAYPVGYYDDRVLRMTKEYYIYGFRMGGGIYKEGEDTLTISRVYIPRNYILDQFINAIKY